MLIMPKHEAWFRREVSVRRVGVSVASEVLEDHLTDWHREMEGLHRQVANLGLKERQVDALALMAQTGRLTRRDYMDVANVRPLTATRDLADLVGRGLLVATGRTRDRVYELAARTRGEPGASADQPRLPL